MNGEDGNSRAGLLAGYNARPLGLSSHKNSPRNWAKVLHTTGKNAGPSKRYLLVMFSVSTH